MFQLDPRPRQEIVSWAQIIPALRVTGYDGWLSLELEMRWYPGELPSEEEAFRRSAAFLRVLPC